MGKPADPSPETSVRRRLPHLGKKLHVFGLLSSTPWAAEAGGGGGGAYLHCWGTVLALLGRANTATGIWSSKGLVTSFVPAEGRDST